MNEAAVRDAGEQAGKAWQELQDANAALEAATGTRNQKLYLLAAMHAEECADTYRQAMRVLIKEIGG